MGTTPEYNTILMQLPTSVRGFTKGNADGSYTIVLNACLDHETQLKTCKHELEHILEDDLNSEASVQKIESVRHALTVVTPKNEISDPESEIMPAPKRQRQRHRKQYQYYEQRAAFFKENFSESRIWQIAESQHLYKGL